MAPVQLPSTTTTSATSSAAITSPVSSPTSPAAPYHAAAAAAAADAMSVDERQCCRQAADAAAKLAKLAAERSDLERRVADGSLVIGGGEHSIRLVRRIGSGSFGDVYLGLTADGRELAVKVALAACQYSSRSLLHEGDVYRRLAGSSPGLASVHWYGMHGSDYCMLAMDLLGPTLYDIWSQLGQRFSMRTLLTIVDQTLEAISGVHRGGFVHRDISPSNFMLSPDRRRVHLIDFGQAKKVVTHVVPASRHRVSFVLPMVGTPRFVSVFAHAGVEASFRDDLESLGYMWIYLGKGQLPWQGIRDCSGGEKIQRIGQLKMATSVQELCEGLPDEFAAYMNYVRSLRQFEMPDYAALRQVFCSVAERLGLDNEDATFDWLEADCSDNGNASAGENTTKLQHSDIGINAEPETPTTPSPSVQLTPTSLPSR